MQNLSFCLVTGPCVYIGLNLFDNSLFLVKDNLFTSNL